MPASILFYSISVKRHLLFVQKPNNLLVCYQSKNKITEAFSKLKQNFPFNSQVSFLIGYNTIDILLENNACKYKSLDCVSKFSSLKDPYHSCYLKKFLIN